jgi:hypothetical protein
MAVRTLRDLGFCFDLLTAADVRTGGLRGYQLLVIPGGWASLKCNELGADGMEQVREFVAMGGGYLGLCGGAGLALQVDEGLGLLPVTRKPMSERLPNFSGSIRVRQTSSHPLWWGLPMETSLQVWWPSQFELLRPEEIQVLGRYGEPESDFCVSDLNVQDTETAGINWEHLERTYEINLDPERLLNEPAVLEGCYGKGRVVLSYPHLETPGDEQGNLALFNIWYDLLETSPRVAEEGRVRLSRTASVQVDNQSLEQFRTIVQESEQLVALGERRNLWSWRNSWLLKWKRGIRGSEFGTVQVLLRGLVEELERSRVTPAFPLEPATREVALQIGALQEIWNTFRDKAEALLEAEDAPMNGQMIAGEVRLSDRVQELRTQLFSCVHCYGSKSYGALYRLLLDRVDSLLLTALSASSNEKQARGVV